MTKTNTSASHETSEEHLGIILDVARSLAASGFRLLLHFCHGSKIHNYPPPPLFPLGRSHGSHRRIGLQHGSAISAKDLRAHSLKLPEFPVGLKTKCSVTFFFKFVHTSPHHIKRGHIFAWKRELIQTINSIKFSVGCIGALSICDIDTVNRQLPLLANKPTTNLSYQCLRIRASCVHRLCSFGLKASAILQHPGPFLHYTPED